MNLARRRSPASLLLLLPFLALAGCGSLFGHSKTYPELRDIPAAPATQTPEAERERLKQDLDRERSGGAPATQAPATGKLPAVPPRPLPPHAANESPDSSEDCGSAAQAIQIAQAIPPLRGTLHGGPAAPRRPPVAAAEGEGITGAIRAPAGPVEVRFDPGSADLPSAVVPTLKARAERLAAGKGTIFIEAHGSQSAGLPRGTVRSIQNLSLGLKRASAIANVLISLGVASDRIKLIVPGEDDASPLEPAAADVARISFEAGT